ncbi:uncharacterized protein LOC123320463 [Coccinella septempunctata]|uniref:uncharacterized protein LOC123320463 n=1 Tax=Coccinella septempunctata TaxID=41139 RepID=UPI001D05EF2C|nr:uncharacterized protein LOC123320463 [Coccinella septempunctata]
MEMICCLEEAKTSVDVNKINQPASSLTNTFGKNLGSQQSTPHLSDEEFERILCVEKAKIFAESNKIKQSDYSFSDILGKTSEPQPSPQQNSNEELEIIVRLAEAKIFADSNKICQPDSSLSNNFGMGIESQELSEKVLCSEKASAETNKMYQYDYSLSDDIFGMSLAPQQSTPQLCNEELEMMWRLDETGIFSESNISGNSFESQESAPQLSDEEFERILCVEKAKVSAEGNRMNQSDYSLFDIFGTLELQPSPQQLSNEEMEMILRLEETKSFAESNNINQPDFSLFNKHGVSFESEQSFSQHCEKVLCSEKAKVSSASNNFDNFGMIHGQLTDVEFERILGLGESNVSAESTTQINRSHSDQYMTDWNSQEPIKIDDMFNGHSSHQAPDTQLQNSIISPDSGICDEGLAESDSSSSTPPTYSQIFKVKDHKDQCLQQKECYRTSVPKSTPYVFNTKTIRVYGKIAITK